MQKWLSKNLCSYECNNVSNLPFYSDIMKWDSQHMFFNCSPKLGYRNRIDLNMVVLCHCNIRNTRVITGQILWTQLCKHNGHMRAAFMSNHIMHKFTSVFSNEIMPRLMKLWITNTTAFTLDVFCLFVYLVCPESKSVIKLLLDRNFMRL